MTSYNFFRKLLYPFLKVAYNFKVYGKENIPQGGGYIVSGNHAAYRDPVLIALGSNRDVRFVAKGDLLRFRVFKPIFRIFRVIPIKRGESDRHALKYCCDIVKEGDILGIFPQGKRIPLEEPYPEQAMSGTGYIAMVTKAVVLPVKIEYKKNKPRMFSRTKIIFGKPVPYEEYTAIEGGDPTRKQVSEYLFAKTCELTAKK